MTHGWGGLKNPECRLWAGALNHADLRAVVAKVAEITWTEPERVQLFVKDQEQLDFDVWMMVGGQLRQLLPLSDGLTPVLVDTVRNLRLLAFEGSPLNEAFRPAVNHVAPGLTIHHGPWPRPWVIAILEAWSEAGLIAHDRESPGVSSPPKLTLAEVRSLYRSLELGDPDARPPAGVHFRVTEHGERAEAGDWWDLVRRLPLSGL